jgi:hypothetical protein
MEPDGIVGKFLLEAFSPFDGSYDGVCEIIVHPEVGEF